MTDGPLPTSYDGFKELVSARRSTRRYQPRPLAQSLWHDLTQAVQEIEPLNEDRDVVFHPVPRGGEINARLQGVIGRYGRILNAPHYIALLADEGPGALVEVGFRGEQLTLAVTALGVATCWIGGLFDESEMRLLFPEPPELKLIALIAVGHPADGGVSGFFNRKIKGALAFGGKRLPMTDIFRLDAWDGEPFEETDSPAYRAAELARLAPSWANFQPWRLIFRDGEIYLCAGVRQGKGRLGSNIHHGRAFYRLDAGIFAAHFHLAAHRLGLAGRWRIVDTAPELDLPEGNEALLTWRRPPLE